MENMRKKSLWILGGFWMLAACVFTPVSCEFDIANISLSRDNSDKVKNLDRYASAWEKIDFMEHAQPLVFGPSTTDGGCTVTLGGFPATGEKVPDGMVEIRSVGGAGKVAGSEDGIAYFFKRVDINKNFIMEADFTVKEFGTSNFQGDKGSEEDNLLAIHGQHSFGIMARDHVPQWDNMTFTDVSAKTNLMQNRTTSNSYRTGNRGGDSNMIMVGGIKQGMRVYWREGVKKGTGNTLRDPATGEASVELESGNPAQNEYQDASQCKFGWYPRELGDYTSFVNSAGVPTIPARPDFPIWGSTYTLRLERTNNGFVYSIRAPSSKGTPPVTGTVPLSDILDSINKEEFYVGFFAGREARVWVSNIKYSEANSEDCAPYIQPDPSVLSATFEVVSAPYYSGHNYIYAKSNVPGELIVTQGGRQIPNEVIFSEWVSEAASAAATPHNMFTIPTWDFADGDNHFTLAFYPSRNLPKELAEQGEGGQILGSNAVIRRSHIVSKKVFLGGTGDIWVSKTGSPRGNGNPGSPLDLQTAINHVQPGQTVIVKDGTYTMFAPIVIPRYNNGRFGALKTLRAETHPRDLPAGGTTLRHGVFFDFNKNQNLKMNAGVMLDGNYWKLEGFCIENSPNKTQGMIIGGHNNFVSWVTTHSSGDTGMQISGSASEPRRYWPSNNIIEYCESFNNMDDAKTDADGFAAKLTVGAGNRFLWCISHNNCDDGWDLFTKKETGPIGVVKVFGCVSYENLILLDGSRTEAGGNGFKMGGEGISIRHEIHQSSSFGNAADAFTSNSNPSLLIFNSTNVGRINISSGDSSDADGRASNCWSGDGSDYNTVLVTRTVNGQEYKKFLNRLPDGRPDMGNVFRRTTGDGATVFYTADKPEPPAGFMQ
jgi:hypothetical protein